MVKADSGQYGKAWLLVNSFSKFGLSVTSRDLSNECIGGIPAVKARDVLEERCLRVAARGGCTGLCHNHLP